jgi:hypothetical protein
MPTERTASDGASALGRAAATPATAADRSGRSPASLGNSNLPCHADALAAKGGLGRPEFRSIITVDDRREDGIRMGLPEVQ